ncbi:MAG: cation:proton antiporter [Planctomycetota bacterium]
MGSRTRTILVYGLMILGAALAFLLIRAYGRSLAAPEAAGGLLFGAGGGTQKIDELLHVLLALVVVIAVARFMGQVFKYLQQPPVIGEVLAGIMLGPSLLGRVWPEAAQFVLPPSIAPFLRILSQVGVILYMFLVGLELDTDRLRKGTHSTVAISHASIITPFLLGSLLALWLYPRFSSRDVPFTIFALFMGVSMSVTAFPVLARILTDRGIQRSFLGVMALSCAAVDDATAWCLLAFVVAVADAEVGRAWHTAVMTLAFILGMVVLIRPLLHRLAARVDERGRLTQGVTALIVVAMLLSALTTEIIGVHALFGAFLLGAVIPHDSVIARELTHRLNDVVVVLFLPAFFAFTGMRTQIGLLSGLEPWLFCGVIVFVACLGKFGGSTVAARLTGVGWRESAALGVLMNTRGLMELIVLNVGLDHRVLSPTLFAMLVIMAVVTTLITAPVLYWLTRGHRMVQAPDSEFGAPIKLHQENGRERVAAVISAGSSVRTH